MKVLNVFFTWCTVDQINSFIFNIWSKSTKYWILASNVIKEELRRHNVFLLISSNNKENVTFTWSVGVQCVLFFTITGNKFVIYVPIRRYLPGKWLATPGNMFFYARCFNQSKVVMIFKPG
jgi:hypothetical protein